MIWCENIKADGDRGVNICEVLSFLSHYWRENLDSRLSGFGIHLTGMKLLYLILADACWQDSKVCKQLDACWHTKCGWECLSSFPTDALHYCTRVRRVNSYEESRWLPVFSIFLVIRVFTLLTRWMIRYRNINKKCIKKLLSLCRPFDTAENERSGS